MSTTITINHFDRGKPFYPLVMNYIILLAGFKDLAGRGVLNELTFMSSASIHPGIDDILKDLSTNIQLETSLQAQSDTSSGKIETGIKKLFGPLELKSEFQGNRITVDINEVAQELFHNSHYIITFLLRSAGSLLILAHEISKDEPWHDKGSLWEFLRHCRNAAAHGGSFDLRHGEPRRLAEWGQFRIEPSLNGTPLFKNASGVGLLSPGDPIRLLWDIEQAYPSMS